MRGNSNDEIKVSPLAEEYSGDDSEPAGKIYQFDAAGNYTVNEITFHAEENFKAQTILAASSSICRRANLNTTA